MNGHQGHQRVTSVEEDFIIQVDKITCLVDIRQLSSSDTLVMSHRHRNQAAMLEGMYARSHHLFPVSGANHL